MLFLQLADLFFCVPESWASMINELVELESKAPRKDLWVATTLGIIWPIWLERNERVFNASKKSRKR